MSKKHNISRKNYRLVLGVIVVVLALIAGLFFQQEKAPIKVGFIGNLTGGGSNWGVGPRNGALLAIEAVNAAGGINGHKIEVITRDDQMNPKLSAQSVKELDAEGVVAIIGPTSSAAALGAVPAANDLQMLLIGPTVSTEALTGQDDFFVRTDPLTKWMAYDLADYLYNKKQWRIVAAAFETSNRAYSEDVTNQFKKAFEAFGGTVLPAIEFAPGSGHAEIAKKLTAQPVDGIYIAAEDIDTAYICQEVRKQGFKIPFADSGTAITADLIRYGGFAVEGILSPQATFVEAENAKYQSFSNSYKQRYGEEPSNIPGNGYDAANVLIEALKQSKEWTPVSLKKTILQIKRFESIFGDLEFDAYGEVRRPTVIVTVENGQFVRVQ